MIRMNNFDRQYDLLKDKVKLAIDRVLKSSWYVLGKEVAAFEEEFAYFCDQKYCVGVASGTDALILSLKCAGIGQGDEVITTDLTAYPTITAIQAVGAIPVTVDTDIHTGLINPDAIESAISERTKAIIPVHLYGQACDMDEIVLLSKQHSLTLIEDCAQATGAKYKTQQVGSFGDFSCFSFYPTKNLGAYGDAGAICTNSKQQYEKLLSLRNYGQTERYVHGIQGLNSRLDEIQAAILRVKLPYLSQWNKRRQEIAKFYQEHLPKEIQLSFREGSVFHLFPILIADDRQSFMDEMKKAGIETLIHYPIPINQQEAYDGVRFECTNTQSLCDQLVSLPICPFLRDEEVQEVIKIVKPLINTDNH
jgi:dTDP-4-amino-4,6-dideoxygalactose transaminase